MTKTLLIDTEGGATSVRHLVNDGHVTVVEADTLDDVEKVYWRLHKGEWADHGVIVIDTLTALATTNRHLYVRKESGVAASIQEGSINRIWDKQVDNRRMWQRASDPMIMLLRQFRGLSSGADGRLTILTTHERMREDEMDKTTKGGPGVNPMLLSDVTAFSDDVFRIRALVRPLSIGGKTYQRGDRLLYMATNENLMTKIRIGAHLPYPEELVNPNLFELQKVMQEFFPRRLTLFGAPGAGKTVLACSFSDPILEAKYNQPEKLKGNK